MKAEVIRKQILTDGAATDISNACFWLREIAAQLAEGNERLEEIQKAIENQDLGG